jgi:hypothetical protein
MHAGRSREQGGETSKYMREFEHITLARVLVAGSDRSYVLQAEGFLERLLQAAEHDGRIGSVIKNPGVAGTCTSDARRYARLPRSAATRSDTRRDRRLRADLGRRGRANAGAASSRRADERRSFLCPMGTVCVRYSCAPESASAGPVVTGLAEPLTARNSRFCASLLRACGTRR